jgi:NHLM bacteriocin system ABC transporter ATP-binding protein
MSADSAVADAAPPAAAPKPAASTPQSDQDRLQDSLRGLAALGGQVGGGRREPPRTGDALFDALAAVTQAIGVKIHGSAQSLDGMELERKLALYGHLSGFRFRKVALDGTWWADAAVALLGFDGQTGQPVALVPEKARYRAYGERGNARQVDRAYAGQLSADAYILYPSLPERATPLDFLRLALHGTQRDILGILVSSAGAAILGLAVPIVLGQLVATAIPEGRSDLLFELVAVLVAATVGAAMLEAYKTFTIAHLTGSADLYLQASLWDRVLRLRSQFFETYQTGDIAMRVIGIDTIRRMMSSSLLGAILGGVFSIVNLVVMLVYDAALAGWAILYALVLGAVLSGLTIAQIRLQRVALDRQGRIQALIVQFVNAMPKLRSSGVERRAFARWADVFQQSRIAEVRSLLYRADATILQMMMIPVASLGLLALFRMPEGGSTTADFIAFNAAMGLFLAAIVGMFSAATNILTVVPVWDRIKPILSAPVDPIDEREDPGRLTGAISVRNLRFGYLKDAPPVLDGVSFDVSPGEFVAIVGPSGCGKSTLLRLLLGFDEPDSGAILYDGRDFSKLDAHRVRQQIGTVMQVTSLLGGSIFDNVAGAGTYSEADVMDALGLAGLVEDIRQLPMGLHTVVTEGRSTFSGGQRQRLMIARALINRPSILFFDEATSALDNKTQLIVSNSIDALKVTRIVIAHRLSTIRKADRIVVIKDGGIAETGNFEELMARKGFFYTLAARQIA